MPIGCGISGGWVPRRSDSTSITASSRLRQQARPVGRDLAPKLLSRTLADKRALGAIAIDQPFAFEHVERFANGRARHAAFSRQIVHRRRLFGDRPVAGLDAAAEQARELDVTRDDASIQIDRRSFALLGLHFVFDLVLRDPRYSLVLRDMS